MKLTTVSLDNFKYHKNISLNCQGKNILVYGENGVGKTSVFRALYSLLYHHKDKSIRNEGFYDKYINKTSLTEDLKVQINFDEGNSFLQRVNNTVQGSEIIKALPRTSNKLYEVYPEATANVFMFEAKDLDELLEGSFDNQLMRHFGGEYGVESIYRDLKTKLESTRDNSISESEHQKSLRDLRISKDEEYKHKINSLINEEEMNKILVRNFHWKERVVFSISDSDIDFSSHPYRFNPPRIKIFFKENNQKDSVVDYINEAKLKVLSLTVFLCGILKQPKRQTNVLVLDDFVNSLDMANRRFIVDALLESLNHYQILIFTHNINFYQLVRRILNNLGKKQWVYKKLIDFKSGPEFVEDSNDYLREARNHLDNGALELSANLLRKQFELVCYRFETLLSLGRYESMNILLEELKSGGDQYYKEPNNLIKDLIKIFDKLKKNIPGNTLSGHIGLAIEFENKISGKKFIQGENAGLLKEITLMKDVLLNPASHNNPETTIHKAECEYAFELISKLTGNLDAIQKNP